MAESDAEYVDNMSDEEEHAHQVTRNANRDAGSSRVARAPPAQPRARWEDIQRSWDTVVEGTDGSINNTVAGLLEANKRKRLLKDTTPFQRGIIRHLVLILDLSFAMTEKDLRPTRYLLTLRYATEFVNEFFEQNPISQLAILGMRDGIAVRVSDMSGNPTQHTTALADLRTQEPQGNPSLQNALVMARGALFQTPSHGTREVVVVFGALLTSDPGDIHQTIRDLIKDRIRVSVVGLAAQVAICRELVVKTNGGEDSGYGVALNEQHFRDLLLTSTTPPATSSASTTASSLLMMGFPSRVVEPKPSLCACHARLTRGGYFCSRCNAKVCQLPAECPTCGLTLILSTHLARSYHHLFPLQNWIDVSWGRAKKKGSTACFACLNPFPGLPSDKDLREIRDRQKRAAHSSAEARSAMGLGVKATEDQRGGRSESGRYECETCHNHFCIDCDVFSHEVVHNCPGCQSVTHEPVTILEGMEVEMNGNGSGMALNGRDGHGSADEMETG